MLSFVDYGGGMARLMNGDWQRLADYVRSARVEQGFGSQLQLARAAGVSEGSVRALESGKSFTRMPVTTPKIERALGWQPGTARLLLEGKNPFEGVEGPAITQEQKEKFIEVVARSKTITPAVREQMLAEIEATPIVTSD